MADDQPPDADITATSASIPTLPELLEERKKEIAAAGPEEVGELYRQYVNLFLANEGHPEQNTVNPKELTDLALRITASLGFSKNGVTPDITRQQLVALLGKQESESTDPSKTRISSGADPIMMFNGQFIHESEDIRINGAGINFVFKRTYKNQVTYNGPLGFNWDHSYNLWLRVADDTIFRSTGGLREDAYVRNPNNYFVPPDGQHGIIKENDTLEDDVSFIWRAPDGDQCIYKVDPSRRFLHRIKRIEDKHGNYLRFNFDQFDRLSTVIVNDVHPDNPQRIITFVYDEQDRIKLISDYTKDFGPQGRQCSYTYDDLGDLIAVTTPATDRYPEGLTTCYEYSSVQFTGALQHNLTRIIDPTGQMHLENEYGTEAGLLHFNRVVRQRQGGGEASFEYEDIVQEFDFGYRDKERPAHQTTMIERNGHPVHYIYNKFGNLLLREENLLQEGLPRLIQWRYQHNADGTLIGILTPDGVVMQYYYGREDYLQRRGITDEEVKTDDQLTASERMAFGNLLAVVKRGQRFDFAALVSRSGLGAWGDFFPNIITQTVASDIITKFTYEPDYQQILTLSDPRFTQSADPAAVGPPLETPRYRETLTMYVYSGRPGDPATNPHLFLRRIEYPDTRLPDGTTLTNSVQHYTDYDDRGRLLRSIDREGIVTELEYFDAASGVREGYLKRRTIDPSGLAITTRYEVNEVGIPTAIIHPRAVGAPPGRFRTTFAVNALNQVFRTTTSPPFSYEARSFYDRNGQVERVERDLKDENGMPLNGGVEVKSYCYDEQNNLIKESIGGLDPATHLITHHTYNESDKRVRTILPKGNRVRRIYDERLLEISVTRGSGSSEASTTRTVYSSDGLKVQTIDGRGNITRNAFDPFNRLIKTVDPLGNVALIEYDKAGNITVERFFEKQAVNRYLFLTRSEYEYDELNRRIIERKNLFPTPLAVSDPETDPLASSSPGILLETQFFRDKKGRLIKIINRKGQETIVEYDAMDSKISERDALGDFTRLIYDADGNLSRRDVHERVIDPSTGTFLREDVFSTFHDYDELDRMVSTTDSLGNTTRFSYDSRNSLVKQVDPLGNAQRFEYDVYGRKVAEIAEMTDTGLGGGAPLGLVITGLEYDSNSNVVAYIDAKANRTEQEFDLLDRRITVRYSDSTTQEFAYDAGDHVIMHKDNNGLKRLYTFDVLDRMIRMDLDASGIAIEGATFEEFAYDGLRRVTLERNDYATTEKKVDSLGRVYEEIINFHITTPDVTLLRTYTIQRQFDALGNLLHITYPSGRMIRYHLDTINRIERIENVRKGADYPGSTTLPDNYEILHNEYRGLRKTKITFGNGASTSYAFDGNGHLIQIAHVAIGDSLTIQHLYDAAGNMRIKNDITPRGNRGEAYKYNSLYWLTKVEERAIPPFTPLDFEPASLPLPANMLHGQTQIDALIRPLAQDPTDFTFQYDQTGNREEEREPGQPPLLYVPNNLNQYSTVGTETLSYDLNGNLIQDRRWQYSYDYRNQLVRVFDPATNQNVAQFFYDGRGRRILSLMTGQATHLIFDGQNIIEERQDGAVLAQYVSEYGLDTICQITVQTQEHWYHKDIVRSTRLLTGSSGLRSAEYNYEVFGKFIPPKSGPYNPYCYMSRRLDVDALDFSLYCYRSRHYATHLGRFLQRDTSLTSEGYNVYLAFGNTPLVFSDPLGREKKSETGTKASGWFTEPAFSYQPDKHAILEPEGPWDSGIAIANFGRNLGASIYNVVTIPVNAIGDLFGLPEDIGRALGMPEVDIEVMNQLIATSPVGFVGEFSTVARAGVAIDELSTVARTGVAIDEVSATPNIENALGAAASEIRSMGSEVIVRKTVPLEDLGLIRQGTVGKPGQIMYVTLPTDMEGIVGMEGAFDRLTLNYENTKFTRSGTAIELELQVPNQGFEVGEGTQGYLGWTKGEAIDLTIPSQPNSTVQRFRIHSSGHTSPWIEGNPFQ